MAHIVKRISERERKEVKMLRRDFQLIGDLPGNGFSFPANQDGSPDTTDENYECWKENFKYALSNPDKYEDQGLVIKKWSYTEPARVKCSCGAEIFLDGDTVCECGQWYNGFGQALVNPEYLEEDLEEDY